MSKVEELLAKYNPNGVFQSDLREVSSIIRGKRVTKRDVKERGDYPVISGGESPMGYYDTFNRDANTITIAQYGAAGYVDFQKNKFWANDVCYSILPFESVDNKYLYYTLKSKQNFIYSIRNTDAVPFSLPINTLYSIQIPLPHIKVQEEIVKILDSFTNLIDALNEELSLRQKQFEYYREKLLTFDDKSLLKPINEIGTLFRGNGLQKKDFVDEGVGCIHYGQIYTKLGFSLSKPLTYVTKETAKPLTKVRKGDLVIACTSENIEDVCKSVVWEGEEEIVTGGHACVLRHNENPRYIGYFFQTHQFFMQKKQYAYGAKVIRVSGDSMSQFILPIPSLAIQQSIVEKLDAFESLISSLKEEIALRQKQYEYYREKLLTFD